MSRFQAVPYEDQSEINLSPMLDVVFIMLIFFIVVASFVNEDGLPVTLPQGIKDVPVDIETISITVEATGSKVKDAVIAIEAGRRIGFDVVPIARLE